MDFGLHIFKEVAVKPINLPVVPYSVLITYEGRCYIAKSLSDWKQRHQYNEKDGTLKNES